jgi:hypothetical protein
MNINRKTTLLYPEFSYKLKRAVIAAQKADYDVHIFETWRSPERQTVLKASKDKVTNADKWMSWHQYGLAADIAFGGEGKWHWKGDFIAVSKFFIDEGLQWGGAKDAGHYEYHLNLSILNAKKINEDLGVLGVWEKISQLEPKETK